MEGYEKLAAFMASHQEFAVFQRFDFLNTLNILYLQAELVEFEAELKRCMKQDLESGDDNRCRGARDWWFLANTEGETWETMLKARKVLKDYNEALHLQRELKRLSEPCSPDLTILRNWFLDTKKGNEPLDGLDKHVWRTTSKSSLVALKTRKGADPLATLFLHHILNWWHLSFGYKLKKKHLDEEAQYVEYRDKSFEMAANVMGSIFSTVILIGSIVALYATANIKIRLVLTGVFTLTFSLVLVLVVGASKVEMFAATAAFVAVQVVFVGNIS